MSFRTARKRKQRLKQEQVQDAATSLLRENFVPTGKFRFPRHISVSNHEYEMESMETKDETEADKSDGFTYRLDPDRVRTDAEVAVFAEVFKISIGEARRILKESGRECQS